ncbi:hypothetical protein QLX67_13540, partial [Balneolaceae bacterium ANBcel3]|nr:hypothetical protein [Balneolaceae bacterium ANBcel3]
MQNRYISIVVIFLISLLFFSSCDSGLKGTRNENIPPSTYLTMEDVNLEDDNGQRRLVSQIHISWWGDDPDGYVIGYEYVITEKDWEYTRDTEHQVEWTFTQQTDSVFVLPIPPGEDISDVRFTVRAIDNEQLRDPDGASVIFPIRNSPPTIQLHKTVTPQHDMEVPPDTTFQVASFGWTADDPDGEDNLSHYEVAVNDTTQGWLEMPVDASFLTVLVDQSDAQSASASVYIGRSLRPSDLRLNHFQLNNRNTFYIRAIDKALAVSEVDTVSWYMKEQTSNVLFINDFPGSVGDEALPFHMELLQTLGIETFDYLDTRDGVASGGRKAPLSEAFHRPVDPTLNKMLSQWDHIYWISGDLDRNITYALRSTLTFFENGGTMFVNVPTKNIPDNDAVLDFLPFEKVAEPPAGFNGYQILNNQWLVPSINGLDSL